MSKKRIIGMITIAALMAGLVAMPVMAGQQKENQIGKCKSDSKYYPGDPHRI